VLDAVPASNASAKIPFGFAVKIGGNEQMLSCQYNGWQGPNGCFYGSQPGQVGMPATSYYPSGHKDYRVDVFADGRALVVGGGATQTCYPNIPSQGGGLVTGCTIYSPAGGQIGNITFQTVGAADEPSLGVLNLSAPAGISGVLYAY
jgi:hypothetical protein